MRVFVANTDGDLPADADDHLVAHALRERDVDVEVVAWDADVDWAAADAVLIRSTWDYTDRLDEFLTWADRVEAVGTRLLNPADVVRWNSHKGYLLELEERGAPIVPTAWLGRGDRVTLAAIAADRGWDGVVAKPAIGAGARGLVVVRPGEAVDSAEERFAEVLASHDVLVQPFVPGVLDGELSITVIDGTVSHAVRKVPPPGDIRAQIEFGGRYEPVEVDRDTARLAEWVVESTGVDLLYARVDLLPDVDGTWLLGELEAIEPALMLEWAPGAAERLVDALLRRLTG